MSNPLAPQPVGSLQKRILSIDIVRGIAMVIMALDHVRDYFHVTANTDDPLNLDTTTPALFFTRWVTHFCAPVFVFLSGTSVYLQSLRKTRKALGFFLLKRGAWLILAEWTLIAFAWTFDPRFSLLPLQVIWAIGISMVILGALVLIRLPYKAMLILGILIVAGHNLLDMPESAPGFQAGFWWNLLHHGYFVTYPLAPGHDFLMVYPFLAWTGVMIMGYCAGALFTAKYSPEQRKKLLLQTGAGLLLLFILLRGFNVYGDPHPWIPQSNGVYSLLSFFNVHKYPPSLLYLCITIGPALIMLALIEKTNNRFTTAMTIYGRTAFFYYILHLYLIHVVAAVFFFAGGHTMQQALASVKQVPFMFVLPGVGIGLAGVYGIWVGVVVLLYPLCKRYDRYKSAHREKWWLSYL